MSKNEFRSQRVRMAALESYKPGEKFSQLMLGRSIQNLFLKAYYPCHYCHYLTHPADESRCWLIVYCNLTLVGYRAVTAIEKFVYLSNLLVDLNGQKKCIDRVTDKTRREHASSLGLFENANCVTFDIQSQLLKAQKDTGVAPINMYRASHASVFPKQLIGNNRPQARANSYSGVDAVRQDENNERARFTARSLAG